VRLNVQFKEGRQHAWLLTDDAAELFIQRPLEAFQTLAGSLVCQVPSSQMEEIREDDESDEPSSIFVCCATPDSTKVYSVTESITYAGGDCLLFIQPLATFH
jgi:hypothetical protein